MTRRYRRDTKPRFALWLIFNDLRVWWNRTGYVELLLFALVVALAQFLFAVYLVAVLIGATIVAATTGWTITTLGAYTAAFVGLTPLWIYAAIKGKQYTRFVLNRIKDGCPQCGKPQKCPCPNCIKKHPNEVTWTYTHGGDMLHCGYCNLGMFAEGWLDLDVDRAVISGNWPKPVYKNKTNK